MQSSQNHKVIDFRPRATAAGMQRHNELDDIVVGRLPSRLIDDGWWLVTPSDQTRSRPSLRLVAGCGALKP